MLRRALLLLAALAAPAHGLAKGGGFATKAKPKKEKKPKAAAPPPPLPAGMGDVAVERTSVVDHFDRVLGNLGLHSPCAQRCAIAKGTSIQVQHTEIHCRSSSKFH